MEHGIQTDVKRAAERIDALALRERALIFVGLLGVLFVFAANVLFPPLRAEQSRLELALKAKRDQARLLHAQIQQLAGEHGRDPDTVNRERLAQLRERLRIADGPAGGLAQGLVSPREMARLVQGLLTQNRKLQLLRVENLPPVALAKGGDAKAPPAGDTVIYKHGLRIELRGQYVDILRYLRALEMLPWKMFWGEMRLETENHPFSRVSLIVYTLSPERAWIGV